MANNLTGDYEAVLQVGVGAINRLLATFHRNGGVPDATPSFPHSIEFHLSDAVPKSFQGDNLLFGQWLAGEVALRHPSEPAGQVSAMAVGNELARGAPPGSAMRFRGALERWDEALKAPSPGSAELAGWVQLQLSAPSISLPEGSTSQLILSVFVRAHYHPYPGTLPLPAPIHGEVRIIYEVQLQASDNGTKKLAVLTPADDNLIQFIPANGTDLGADDVEMLAGHIRKLVRGERFKATDVDLGASFPIPGFKAIGGGAHAVALPLQLSGGVAPLEAIGSLTNTTSLAGSGFAFAVSKEYILTQFQPTLEALMTFTTTFSVDLTVWVDEVVAVIENVPVFGWITKQIVKYVLKPVAKVISPTYVVSVTGAELQFQKDALNLEIRAKATTAHALAPNYPNIVINQKLTLVLVDQSVALDGSDDPTITGLEGAPAAATDQARAAIIAERNKALAPAQASLSNAFQSGPAQLQAALSFAKSASVNYDSIGITEDGILLRGSFFFGAEGPSEPIVHFEEAEDGAAYTAFRSWVPGGRITRFNWGFQTPAKNPFPEIHWHEFDVIEVSKRHRFIVPKPAEFFGKKPAELIQVCLEIEYEGAGGLLNEDGQPFRAGYTCGVGSTWTAKPPFVVAPMEFMPIGCFSEILSPPDMLDPVLEDTLAGHIDLLGSKLAVANLTTNTLVHFTDFTQDKPLAALGQALAATKRRDAPLAVFVVLPAGTFRKRRSEVARQLGSPGDNFAATLQVTEDNAGAWTEIFGVTSLPSSYFTNAKAEFVWKQERALDIEALAAALDEHMMPAPPPEAILLKLAVQAGDRYLDATFEDDRGTRLALHRLRGRRILLNFWQSWSAPCIKELLQLQRLHEKGGRRPPVIVAVHCGKDHKAIEEVRREHQLTISLVSDSSQQIARRYGVACWPTTVVINEAGIVNRVQFGITHEHRAEYRAQST